MVTQYRCENQARQIAVRETLGLDGNPLRNGIDFLEVGADQRTLRVYFIHDLPASPGPVLTRDNVRIEGGVRIKGIRVEGVTSTGNLLTVVADRSGDFSTYNLRLVTSPTNDASPGNIDPQLARVPFTFKVDCPSDFDCAPETACPPDKPLEPLIDYLAKDYASFRRLMLDRMAVIMPDWRERNPSDIGIAIVEVLAYVADQLSYYQDAVGTEAYLGTARKRVSVRRHARLLDYPMHDGSNARAWVQVQVNADGVHLERGTQMLTQIDAERGALNLDAQELELAVNKGAQVFETMHDVTLYEGHNEIAFYTWGDEACCLPRGATRATLRNTGNALQNLAAGDVLIFEEVRGPKTGLLADADPTHRHAVRLTNVTFSEDPLFPENPADPPGSQRLRVAEVEWANTDALINFPLCLDEFSDPTTPGVKQPVSVARGNIVLADHGRTIAEAPSNGDLTQLTRSPLTQQGRVRGRFGRLLRDPNTGQPALFDSNAPASTALRWQMGDVLPAVTLLENGTENIIWHPQRDLLNSGRFASEFVVETEEDGTASLRFGDGAEGREPPPGLQPTYRVGNGRAGNVGAEAIAHVLSNDSAIFDVRNPMAARGGTEPESIEQVRLYAPEAFRTQERAVTANDYAAAAERQGGVQRAAATFRWTGSWHTAFVTADRTGGGAV
ncbi:MAG TPA: putative baseplate assembly protein, partial [Chloroflexia bacterium]|nr:putative baseplate assembly protein [Chloroflexia bacterium]